MLRQRYISGGHARLAVAAEIVDTDPLAQILAGFGAVHVADLKAAEVQHAATVAGAMIGQAYSAAVGRDVTDEPVFDAEEADDGDDS